VTSGEHEDQDEGNVFGVEDPFDQWSETPDEHLTAERVAHRAAAAAVRRLVARLADTSASAEQLLTLAERLDRAVDRMPAGARPGAPGAEEGIAEASLVGSQANRLFERSPFVGRANPVAPPLHLAMVDGRIEATVTFGRTYEGPPGSVHGGYVAGIFDEALGAAQSFSGTAGMTARLVVDYRSPTPLNTELRLRAEMASIDGRKITCTGTLHAGDRLCAEAEGLFVTIDAERVRQMLERGGP
jgi:acyl-coenzyme A thioesterase PaaI-like protein